MILTERISAKTVSRHQRNTTFPIAGKQQSMLRFRDMLMSMQAEQPVQKPPPDPGGEAGLSPVEMYEQMTMTAMPEPPVTRNSKTIGSVTWTDETLAVLAEQRAGVPIDIAKAINWESTGDQDLTGEQIAELRESYDLTSLSAQDYYNLMSDLTHWNVISAEDIHSMIFKAAPIGLYPVIAERKHVSFSSGSLLDAIKTEMGSLDNLLRFMRTKQFFAMNSGKSIDEMKADYAYMEARYTTMEKLNSIFTSIQA